MLLCPLSVECYYFPLFVDQMPVQKNKRKQTTTKVGGGGEKEKRIQRKKSQGKEEGNCSGFCTTGVARAFNLHTAAHPELVQLLKEYFGPDNLDSAKMKMAKVGC